MLPMAVEIWEVGILKVRGVGTVESKIRRVGWLFVEWRLEKAVVLMILFKQDVNTSLYTLFLARHFALPACLSVTQGYLP